MAIQSNLKNMVLVLTLTCFGCSAILGGVYAMTKDSIDEAAAEKTRSAISLVLPAFDRTERMTVSDGGKTYNYYQAYTAGDDLVGFAVESTAGGFGGPLTLMVGITPDGIVYNTSVLSHSETPGLGAKCTSDEKFMSQWKGLDPAKRKLKDGALAVAKDGGDIDAITASTITSRAYTEAVQNALNAVRKIMEEESK